ncbi:MAG: NUDIX domain-containing protein [Candidatus Komeilibacteria bacterium]
MKNRYTYAVLATDIVVFTVAQGQLQVLLLKMKKVPFSGSWACPGGLIGTQETPEQAAGRILRLTTGLADLYLEQLYTFGRVDRDPFGRVVSVAYLGLLSDKIAVKTTGNYAAIQWFPINKLPKLAYDHREIIDVAIERLKSKITYTNIIAHLLPREFTLTQLQSLYESILDRPLDRRNFRKKIQSLKLVKPTAKEARGANRPARLYTFTSTKIKIIEIL